MSKRTVSWLSAGIFAVLVVFLVSVGGFEPHRDRVELKIIARGMAFRVEGHPGENPEVRLPARSKVVLHVSNEDPGIDHEFSLPSLERQTRILGVGETDRLTFRSPESGNLEYRCTLHPNMMRGTFRVED